MSMIDKDKWIEEIFAKLRGRFGERLLFLGLQGSYRRGEQGENSDFDAVVILDRVSLSDLAAYRAIVESMPEAEKACGFIGGAEELRAWPRHELFQFVRDTEPRFGDLGALVPEVSEADIRDAVRTGASGIYHAVCHLYVHGDAGTRAEALRDLYKGAFFVLLQAHYLRTGIYSGSRKALAEALAGREREILDIGGDWEGRRERRESDPDALFENLLAWSGGIIRSF